jgi:nitrate/TMAO reductase-like tetraheme cytochrome c subunit
MWTRICTMLAAGWLIAMPAAAGQSAPKPPANDDCLACHGDSTAKRDDGRTIAVDTKRYEASKHGPMACVDCHQDLATVSEFPHQAKLKPVDCASCHDGPAAKYATGVHGRSREKGQTLAAACGDCHGTHDILGAADAASPTNHLNLPRTCGTCHGDLDIIKRANIEIGDVATRYHDSIHGKALEKSGLTGAPSCVDCHGSHDILRKTALESKVSRANVPLTCGTCHEGILQKYQKGVHAAALKKGDSRAPDCADCHSPHSIQRADTDAWRLAVTGECGTCHVEVVDSFRLTFHGKVTELGFTRVAACADCHGAHDILPASNPASTVSKAHLVETCGACHKGANERFVQYDPHPNPRDYKRSAVLWWANRFYWVLIPGCFGFFGLHSLLWFRRSRQESHTDRSQS